MSWFLKTLYLLIGAATGIAIIFGALSYYGWEKVWERAAGDADLGPITFQKFTKGPKPNQALFCPEGLCNPDHVDQISPSYNIPADELATKALEIWSNEPDVTRVDDKSDPQSFRFIQRTKVLRFPDTIRVQIIPIDDQSSTLAIYSQSQIGTDDFGVNLARIKRWLGRLAPYEKQ